jgi:hypothetical protein
VTNNVGPNQFSIVPRPPYHPKYGPIEYKIREAMERIWLKKEEDWTMDRLKQQVMIATHQIKKFDTPFQHCGYELN